VHPLQLLKLLAAVAQTIGFLSWIASTLRPELHCQPLGGLEAERVSHPVFSVIDAGCGPLRLPDRRDGASSRQGHL
jgi:hypothetical protein